MPHYLAAGHEPRKRRSSVTAYAELRGEQGRTDTRNWTQIIPRSDRPWPPRMIRSLHGPYAQVRSRVVESFDIPSIRGCRDPMGFTHRVIVASLAIQLVEQTSFTSFVCD